MKEAKTRTKKDRLFIIVIAIIVANLAYMLFQIIPYIALGGYTNIQAWALALADVLGIVGALWLVRQERRRRKNEQTKQHSWQNEEA